MLVNEIDKKQVEQKFSKASSSYENVANVQKECAKILSTMLTEKFPDFIPSSILDLGTGTGYVPESLLSIFPCSSYSLNDLSLLMLEKAKKKFVTHPNFQFHLGDMEKMDFGFHQLITSNLAMQWTKDLIGIINKLYVNSNVMAFSLLLSGTFWEWQNLLQQQSPINQYPLQSTLENFFLSLLPRDYLFETRDFQIIFENPRIFMQYLKDLGAGASQQEIPIHVLKNLLKNHQQNLSITYKVFFAILKR